MVLGGRAVVCGRVHCVSGSSVCSLGGPLRCDAVFHRRSSFPPSMCSFDTAKALEPRSGAAGPLPSLFVEHVDSEQVWAQLELQNAAMLKYLRKALGKAEDEVGRGDERAGDRARERKRERGGVREEG